MKPTALILVTYGYPYHTELTFLEQEIIYLSKAFTTILVCPRTIGTEIPTNLPKNVLVDNEFSKLFSYQDSLVNKIIKTICSKNFWLEIISKPLLLFQPIKFRKLVETINDKAVTKIWAKNLVEKIENIEDVIFYTYWCNKYTLGICEANFNKKIKVITRVHRGDLYEQFAPQKYLPLQGQIFHKVDKIIAISADGERYIKQKYSWVNNIEISRLGVKPSLKLNFPSSDGKFRIVSCSSVIPVKRVGLIIEALADYAGFAEGCDVDWVHFGDGYLMEDIKAEAQKKLPPNVKVTFFGQKKNGEILKYYEEKPVDVFINLSRSEGIPVSIMEALSYGIPVIATAAGGTSEIVNEENGKLLNKNPTLAEISAAIRLFATADNAVLSIVRNQSFLTWQKKFNAESNYTEFCKILMECLNT